MNLPMHVQPHLSNDEYFKYWRACALSGPMFLCAFIIFWGVLGYNIPPIPADWTADQMAEHFRTNYNQVRAGMAGAMLFGCFYLTWALSINKVMHWTNLEKNDVLPTLQMWGGALTVVPLVTSSVFWLTGAYRPEALDPSILQMLYDQGWLLIDMFFFITTIQMVAFGVAGLMDRRRERLYPRWACWFSIWAGASFVFEVLMPYFYSGLFARQGWLNFWVEFFVWFIFILTTTYYSFQAVPRLARERAELLGIQENSETASQAQTSGNQ